MLHVYLRCVTMFCEPIQQLRLVKIYESLRLQFADSKASVTGIDAVGGASIFLVAALPRVYFEGSSSCGGAALC